MAPVKTRMGHGSEAAQPFVKARRVRSFDDVVDQVRSAILDGSVLAGERLPSERELAEQFGVSRATLREALRALEAVGLIEIRLGAHGGAFATEGAVEQTVEALRHVVAVEVAARPVQAARFRATFHADSITWLHAGPDELARLAGSVPEGASSFLVTLSECTGMPMRTSLAAAIETQEPDSPGPALTAAQMERVVDLLRAGERAHARDLLLQMLTDSPTSGDGQ